MLKLIYTVFLGIILAVFVGVGVSVFYEAPEEPKNPTWYEQYRPDAKELTDAEKAEEQSFMDARVVYDEKMGDYNRNVSMIVAVIAIVLLVLSMTFSEKLDVVADGLLLGGVFTFLYSMGRGLASDDNKYRFFIMTIGLIAALGLGYAKFVRGHLPEPKKDLDK
jgi:hypothetical protein